MNESTFPDKKYKVIYADPPWSYDNKASEGAAEDEYKTMTIDQLCAMPVSELAAEDCALFMWMVHPNIEDGFKVMRAWGFVPKTIGFDWAKQNRSGIGWFFGIGNYTKSNTEPCYLGVKGNVAKMVASDKVSSLVVAPLTKHSRKPDEVRRRIVQVFGDVPRIELFARMKAYGWDAWGNEVKDLPTIEQYTFNASH